MSNSYESNLNMRLNYMGGNQQQRMIKNKLSGFYKALLYSYQAETAILKDNRMFRCLLNPSNEKADYDIKEISIPFKDICLGTYDEEEADEGIQSFDAKNASTTSSAQVDIGMQIGDVFQILKDKTHWLVVQQYHEETAYFRALTYRCDQQVEVGGIKYWVYLRGPNETTLQWNSKSNTVWNDLNYSMVMYITKDENTLENLHRFTRLKLPSAGVEGVVNEDDSKMNTWQVVAVNPYYYDGIIEVMLDEYFNNPIEDERNLEQEDDSDSVISGDTRIYPYDTFTYTVDSSIEGGQWSFDDTYARKLRVISEDDSSIKLYVESGRHFNFTLRYIYNDTTYIKDIEVTSL